MWDEIVDVVAVGNGPGGLACAIAAADADLDVFVARPARHAETPAGDSRRGWLPVVDDSETAEYFEALTAELPTIDAPELVRRAVRPAEIGGKGAAIETFVGSRLSAWAARCLSSPYGVLFTRVAYWPTVSMRTDGGAAVEVAAIGDVTVQGRTLTEWLDALADERGIDIVSERTLQRIVFGEDGRPEGVVIEGPRGSWAVQARLGIAVAPAHAVDLDAQPLELGCEIGLVGQRAGRFGRLEVLRTEQP